MNKKNMLYLLSTVLLFLPFITGFIIGFIWRGTKAGIYCGFSIVSNSLEQELMEEAQLKLQEKLNPEGDLE